MESIFYIFNTAVSYCIINKILNSILNLIIKLKQFLGNHIKMSSKVIIIIRIMNI